MGCLPQVSPTPRGSTLQPQDAQPPAAGLDDQLTGPQDTNQSADAATGLNSSPGLTESIDFPDGSGCLQLASREFSARQVQNF